MAGPCPFRPVTCFSSSDLRRVGTLAQDNLYVYLVFDNLAGQPLLQKAGQQSSTTLVIQICTEFLGKIRWGCWGGALLKFVSIHKLLIF